MSWQAPRWLRDLPRESRGPVLGLPELYHDAELSDFAEDELLRWSEPSWVGLSAEDRAEILEAGPRDVLIQGVNGSGKSYLAAALARSWGASWLRADNYLRALRSCMQGSGTEASVVDDWSRRTVLVLDDLTAGGRTEFASGAILALVSNRIEATRPTIVTTYAPLDAVAEIDPSLASRVAGFEGLKTVFAGHPSGDRRRV